MAGISAPSRPASYDRKVALVLQGGGALGSYQAGVFEVLAASEYRPSWVAGVSIGAINAAIIAGNAPEKRVRKLRQFWEGITRTTDPFPSLFGTSFLKPHHHRVFGSNLSMLFGQNGFFEPIAPANWLFGGPPTSYYDTRALKSTLESHVDFDRINKGDVRLSVGAVNIRTGDMTYFDSAEITIRPEHIMASGALPPAFPAVEIDGEHYWDGGLVSNTPLQYVVTKIPRRSHLIFQIDLFHALGSVPADLDGVAERDKDIRYSSRTRTTTDVIREIHDVRHNINLLWEALPDALRATPEARFLYEFGCITTMDIVQLIYRPSEGQGHFKDYDFGRSTMDERWAQGRRDAETTLAVSPWLAPMPHGTGARTFDVLLDQAQGTDNNA